MVSMSLPPNSTPVLEAGQGQAGALEDCLALLDDPAPVQLSLRDTTLGVTTLFSLSSNSSDWSPVVPSVLLLVENVHGDQTQTVARIIINTADLYNPGNIHKYIGGLDIDGHTDYLDKAYQAKKHNKLFLAAQSSSRSLVVGPSVGWSHGPLVGHLCEIVTFKSIKW